MKSWHAYKINHLNTKPQAKPTNRNRLHSRPLKNVFEAVDTRQKQAKKRSLYLINVHFEPALNTAAATQIVSQRPDSVSILLSFLVLLLHS
ncbi:hypothetical protein C7H79_08190 [Nitrosomonas supralitoralis]|uniref:Uncharacterized protein n=1 Tax=Nitrosomonas supralitoralis TaxID=2116706 RepID=A0A2P7NVK3_9PROT|nr:hypothetical protein C7H79_08190 [Nitrosomonas supralitoralis]